MSLNPDDLSPSDESRLEAPVGMSELPENEAGHPDLWEPTRRKREKNEVIERLYTYRKPDPTATINYTRLRVQCKQLAYLLNEILPINPQAKHAQAALEEVFLWGQASIANTLQ